MLNDLKKTTTTKKTRVARGPGSKGKTAGRGHKGQNSRSGGGVPILFEGGQSSFVLRTPKRGFKNYNRIQYDVINVGQLNKIETSDEINKDFLIKIGKINGSKPIKILGHGDLNKKFSIKVDAFSKSAESKVKSAGGSIVKVWAPLIHYLIYQS